LELPEKPTIIHYIRTDDPDGIESYWHGRFSKLRTNGEWFLLGPMEIKTFKKKDICEERKMALLLEGKTPPS